MKPNKHTPVAVGNILKFSVSELLTSGLYFYESLAAHLGSSLKEKILSSHDQLLLHRSSKLEKITKTKTTGLFSLVMRQNNPALVISSVGTETAESCNQQREC